MVDHCRQHNLRPDDNTPRGVESCINQIFNAVIVGGKTDTDPPADLDALVGWLQCQGMYSQRVVVMLESAKALREAVMLPAARAQQDLHDALKHAVEECLVEPAMKLIQECGASVIERYNGKGLFDFAIWYGMTSKKHSDQDGLMIKELWRVCLPLPDWTINVSKYARGTLTRSKEFQYLVENIGEDHVEAITARLTPRKKQAAENAELQQAAAAAAIEVVDVDVDDEQPAAAVVGNDEVIVLDEALHAEPAACSSSSSGSS